MTQNRQDLLLELCKPYLFDLLTLLAESAKYDDESISELVEGKNHQFSHDALSVVNSLSYGEKISVLNDITSWMDSAENKQQPEQTDVNHDP